MARDSSEVVTIRSGTADFGGVVLQVFMKVGETRAEGGNLYSGVLVSLTHRFYVRFKAVGTRIGKNCSLASFILGCWGDGVDLTQLFGSSGFWK